MTVLQYKTMLEQQGGVCRICGKPEQKRRLAVDHDHKTGRVRGLLCWWCNNKLLASRNTAEMFRRAAEYLESKFDGRLIGHDLASVEPIQALVVHATAIDKAVNGVFKRLRTDPVICTRGLVVMTEATFRHLNGKLPTEVDA